MHMIHNLQQHDNLEIYKKAFNIMDKYFADEDEDTNIEAPAVDASGQFAVCLAALKQAVRCVDRSFAVPFGSGRASGWI